MIPSPAHASCNADVIRLRLFVGVHIDGSALAHPVGRELSEAPPQPHNLVVGTPNAGTGGASENDAEERKRQRPETPARGWSVLASGAQGAVWTVPVLSSSRPSGLSSFIPTMSSRPRLDPGSAQLPPHGLSVDAESGRDSRELVACLIASPRLQDVACGHLRSVHPPRYRSLLEVRGTVR